MDVILVGDDTTRAELEEAIAHLRRTHARGPQGADWDDVYHRRLDALLGAWESAPS